MSVSNFHLAKTISCHAWNGDKSKIALCPNNNEVHIYARNGNDWDLEHVLKEHDESQLITGLDWGAKTNRIVSCSQDRNAYVWKFENGIWKPTLVILRLQRAATSVKWSPLENKFAVSSGAKCVSVCYFEQDNDWWVSKHIKKHKSTVTRLDWHPNNVLLATSSTDYKARVFSAFIKGVDNKPGDTPFGSKLPFGEPLGEWLVGGWVHSIKWSPSGNALAFCSHDSALHVNDLSGGAPGNLQTIRLRELPLVDIVFLNENTIAGVGFDCQPLIFTNNGGTWAFSKKVDVKAAATAQKSGPASAMAVFKNKVETGQVENVTVLDTTHQNSITNLQNLGGNQFSTTGLDGRLVFWKA